MMNLCKNNSTSIITTSICYVFYWVKENHTKYLYQYQTAKKVSVSYQFQHSGTAYPQWRLLSSHTFKNSGSLVLYCFSWTLVLMKFLVFGVQHLMSKQPLFITPDVVVKLIKFTTHSVICGDFRIAETSTLAGELRETWHHTQVSEQRAIQSCSTHQCRIINSS